MDLFAANGHHEASAWGTLLADPVRHIANAQCEEHGTLVSETIEAVLDVLNDELNEPTSDAEGEFTSHPNWSCIGPFATR